MITDCSARFPVNILCLPDSKLRSNRPASLRESSLHYPALPGRRERGRAGRVPRPEHHLHHDALLRPGEAGGDGGGECEEQRGMECPVLSSSPGHCSPLSHGGGKTYQETFGQNNHNND